MSQCSKCIVWQLTCLTVKLKEASESVPKWGTLEATSLPSDRGAKTLGGYCEVSGDREQAGEALDTLAQGLPLGDSDLCYLLLTLIHASKIVAMFVAVEADW